MSTPTWQDVARGYRYILEMLITNLSSTMGEIAFLPVVQSMEVVDAQAEKLASNEETTLAALEPGAIFVTRDGCYAVKSEYFYGNGLQCECILLASGEYAHFPDGNQTVVREVSI